MGALEDYYSQLEAEAQAKRMQRDNSLIAASRDYYNNLESNARMLSGYGPSEEEMRLKRQQIKDLYVMSTQEMRDREQGISPQAPAIPGLEDDMQAEQMRLERQRIKDEYIQSTRAQQRPDLTAMTPAMEIPGLQEDALRMELQKQKDAYIQSTQMGDNEPAPPKVIPAYIGISDEEQAKIDADNLLKSAQANTQIADQLAAARTGSPAVQEQQITQAKRQALAQRADLPVLQQAAATNPMLEYALQGVRDPKDRAFFRQVAEMNAAKAQAQRAAVQSQAQAIQYQAMQQHAEVDAHLAELEPHQQAYGAIQYNAQRDKALVSKKAERDFVYLQSTQIDPKQQEAFLKQKNADIEDKYKDILVPFDKTPRYEEAIAAAKELQKPLQKVSTLVNHLEGVKTHIEAGDMNRASDVFKQNINQELNSISGENALQIGELINRYRNSLGIVDIQEAQGKSSLNLNAWFNAFFQGSAESQMEMLQSKQGKGITNSIINKISANPVRAYELAKEQVDGTIQMLNDSISSVIEATSPRIAREKNLKLREMLPSLDYTKISKDPSKPSPSVSSTNMSYVRPEFSGKAAVQDFPIPAAQQQLVDMYRTKR